MKTIITCPIGFESYDDNEHKPLSLDNCGHTFCKKCLSMIENSKSCPQCRAQFKKTNVNYALLDIISNCNDNINENNKSFETKKKVDQIEKHLKEFGKMCKESKNLVDENFRNMRFEINNYSESRINEIIEKQNNLLKELDELESNSKSKYQNYELKNRLIFNKLKNWKEKESDDLFSPKDREDIVKDLDYLNQNLDSWMKNFNMYIIKKKLKILRLLQF